MDCFHPVFVFSVPRHLCGSHADLTGSVVPSAFASYGGTSVMNRGDHGEPIFQNDRDRFVKKLGEAALKKGRQVHAYCLMTAADRPAST